MTWQLLRSAFGMLLAHTLVGCVSSSTWSAWHATAERVDEAEEESMTAAAEVAEMPLDTPLEFRTCDEVVQAVLAAEPGLVAPRERARAALGRARSVGSLPAPTASIGTWDFPIGDPTLGDREGMYMIRVAQELPPAGQLDGSARAAVAEARVALGELAEMRRVVAATAAHGCTDWAGASGLQVALRSWLGVLHAMRDAVRAAYGSNGRPLVDVARIDREVATAQRTLQRNAGDVATAERALRARIRMDDRPTMGTAPPFPERASVMVVEQALERARERRGALDAARSRRDVARGRVDAARASANVPTFMESPRHGLRRDRDQPQRRGRRLRRGATAGWCGYGSRELARPRKRYVLFHHQLRVGWCDGRALERAVRDAMMRRAITLAAVPMVCALTPACTSPAPVGDGPLRYPATGNTRTFELRVQDVRWEVGPGAVYDAWTYNGAIPGPTLEATAGDRIVVTLINESDHAASVHTHLVEFAQAQDGADPASIAEPGETVTYEWFAPYAGTVPYHDHADEGEGVARGLTGALVIHAPDEVPANEHVVVLSDLEPRNFLQLPGVADPVTGMLGPGEYRGPHQYLHIMNGHAYEDAIPPFSGRVGDLSRWRVVSIGIQAHTFHIHGHRWVDADGTLTDNIQLAPGTYRTFEFEEDREGDWLVHCHFPEHMEGGMMTRYRVTP